jgi:hypothetical protein
MDRHERRHGGGYHPHGGKRSRRDGENIYASKDDDVSEDERMDTNKVKESPNPLRPCPLVLILSRQPGLE